MVSEVEPMTDESAAAVAVIVTVEGFGTPAGAV